MFESTFCHIMSHIFNLSVKKFFKFFLILFVVACGGGGGNSVEPQSNNPISPYASSQATQDTVQNQTQYVSGKVVDCLLYTSPSPRDMSASRMPSSA